MAILAVLLAVTAVLGAVVYFIAQQQHKYWAKRGVNHEKPTPILGNLFNVLTMKHSIYDLMNELYFNHPNEAVVGFYAFTKPMIIIRDLDVIKDVLIKNFSSFVNRSFHCDEIGDPLGSELMFSMWDDQWRRARQKLAFAFTSGKLKDMYPLMDKVGHDLSQLCAETTAQGDKQFDARNFSSRFAVDVITACAFGSEGRAIPTPEKSVMYGLLSNSFQFSFKAGLAANLMFFKRPWYIFLTRLGLGFSVFPKMIEDVLTKVVDQALTERLKTGERRGDIFDQIVFSNDPEFEGLRKKTGASFQMLLGGSETSSTTTFFTLYLLAKHPEVQEKLQKEIWQTLAKNGGQIDYEVLKTMEYLDQVVAESLRLYPVLPFLDRIASRDYKVPGTNIIIEKGMTIFIPLWALQKDPNFFPDPEKFIPERFSKEHGNNFPNMAYLPFGSGPRYCIGKRFGLLTVKSFLVHFCKDYTVHLSEHTKGPLSFNKKNFTLSLLNGMKLIITKSNTK